MIFIRLIILMIHTQQMRIFFFTDTYGLVYLKKSVGNARGSIYWRLFLLHFLLHLSQGRRTNASMTSDSSHHSLYLSLSCQWFLQQAEKNLEISGRSNLISF